jgi:hypothetical protein
MFLSRASGAWGALVLPMSLIPFVVSACSSSSTPPVDAGVDAPPATCASPGEATPGPKDIHCELPDGGVMVQSTSQSACNVAGDAGGPNTCPYNPTMYGHEGDDDDCKYHVAWTSTSICEGAGGVEFTVVATYLGDGSPVTGATIRPEVFTTSPPNDAGCDDMSSHGSPSTFETLNEGPPGTYTGRVVFDEKGAWTARFHLFENCYDVLPNSPHGHAAFHLTVP